MSDEISDEEKRTLWVGGIDSRVDEELLYELMLNAGPIEDVKIPVDKQTKKPKPFAFVRYVYEESLPYAIDLFCDTKLFDRTLRMQNRSTGAGITPTRGRDPNERTSIPNSSPHFRPEHMQPQYMQPNPNFQTGQFNPCAAVPLPFPNMYMNTIGPAAALSNSLLESSSLNNGFIPPFLPLPPGVNPHAFNSLEGGTQDFHQMQFGGNTPAHQNQRNMGPRHREREDYRNNSYSNYNRGEDRDRKRDDRSCLYDRSRSRGYDNHDRRRR